MAFTLFQIRGRFAYLVFYIPAVAGGSFCKSLSIICPVPDSWPSFFQEVGCYFRFPASQRVLSIIFDWHVLHVIQEDLICQHLSHILTRTVYSLSQWKHVDSLGKNASRVVFDILKKYCCNRRLTAGCLKRHYTGKRLSLRHPSPTPIQPTVGCFIL